MTEKKFFDPFDEMNDEEFSDLVVELLDRKKKKKSVSVSLRWDEDLLRRVRREAAAEGIPYQTFIKQIVDNVVSHREQQDASATH
ncbi:MAG: CopG family antitoxin [Candidatus Dormibacteraceae bacterium]